MAKTQALQSEIERRELSFPEQVEQLKKEHPEIQHLGDSAGRQYIALAWYILSRGNVTESCIKAGIGRTQWYEKYMKEPKFSVIVDGWKESIVEMLESDLLGLAKHNVTALIFALTNLAPKKWKDRRNLDVNVREKRKLSPTEISEIDEYLKEAKANNDKGTDSKIRSGESESIPS